MDMGEDERGSWERFRLGSEGEETARLKDGLGGGGGGGGIAMSRSVRGDAEGTQR